jgi:hypothetical protein
MARWLTSRHGRGNARFSFSMSVDRAMPSNLAACSLLPKVALRASPIHAGGKTIVVVVPSSGALSMEIVP